MARESYVWDKVTGEVMPRDEYHARQTAPKRSGLSCPQIITDGCEVKSMVDGRTYTSKAALRRSYRERGYAEVGNEPVKYAERKPDRAGIRASLKKAREKVFG